MIQKISVLSIFFFVLLMLSSCYTITQPSPCPGLVDADFYSKVEEASASAEPEASSDSPEA